MVGEPSECREVEKPNPIRKTVLWEICVLCLKHEVRIAEPLKDAKIALVYKVYVRPEHGRTRHIRYLRSKCQSKYMYVLHESKSFPGYPVL